MDSQPDSTKPGGQPGPAGGQPRPAGGRLAGAERALAYCLWLAVIPVVILVLAALAAFAYGAAVFIHLIGGLATHPFPVGHQVGLFLLDTDLFLIGATLLISAIGFYQLFVRDMHDDPATRVPAWLEIRDLNDLKARVTAMVVLVLAVSFAELAVDSPAGTQVLELGGGVAAVIVALTFFLRLTSHGTDRD